MGRGRRKQQWGHWELLDFGGPPGLEANMLKGHGVTEAVAEQLPSGGYVSAGHGTLSAACWRLVPDSPGKCSVHHFTQMEVWVLVTLTACDDGRWVLGRHSKD